MNKALMNIQSELEAPKDKWNPFGKFSYRSAEGILEALKPLLKEHGAMLTITDSIVCMEGRWYMKSTAIFESEDGTVVSEGWAREPESKKGMDDPQLTGTVSSYARKYALNGLFLIDDAKDADTEDYKVEQENRERQRERQNDPLIGDKQIEQIAELANDKGVTIDAICERFEVDAISELTMTEFVRAVKMLEATSRKGGR